MLKFSTLDDNFLQFWSDEILDVILLYTNAGVARQAMMIAEPISKTTKNEIKSIWQF